MFYSALYYVFWPVVIFFIYVTKGRVSDFFWEISLSDLFKVNIQCGTLD